MEGKVITLPRPLEFRPKTKKLGLYLRIGRNQHKNVLEALGAGKRDFHGLVIDAGNAKRHRELKSRALQLGLDVVLDPRTHAMALPGSYTPSMADLPWGDERYHILADFAGEAGRQKSVQIAEFCAKHQFTQVIAPTHILDNSNDEWLKHDILNAGHLRRELDSIDRSIQLLYSLSVSMQLFRDSVARKKLISALADAPKDAVWLRIENFGADATGDKMIAFIEAARDFHVLNVPIIADQVGGLSGLGLLSFGAVGGLSHGITLLEKFSASSWRRPPREGDRKYSPATRIYIPQLDIHLKRDEADAFLKSSPRTRIRFGCRDSHCCPSGLSDMLNDPTRHFMHQRSSQVTEIGKTPIGLRPQVYLESSVRQVPDDVNAAASLGSLSEKLKTRLANKQLAMARYRRTISHFCNTDRMQSASLLPETLTSRSGRGKQRAHGA